MAMELACLLKPSNRSIDDKNIFLPDGIKMIIGREILSSVYCSREHIEVTACYAKRIVEIFPRCETPIFLNGRAISNSEVTIASSNSIIELIQGAFTLEIDFVTDYDATHEFTRGLYVPKQVSDELISWENACSELVIGTHKKHSSFKKKVAAFDLDNTLIKTKTGRVFALGPDDWTTWHASVKNKLKELFDNDYQIIIFTNQAGLSKPNVKLRLNDFKYKIQSVLEYFEVPMAVYISTCDGYYRKPSPGMWEIFRERMCHSEIDSSQSFFCGDAAGRKVNWKPGKKADFADTDRLFALNSQLKFFTPEEFFLEESLPELPDPKFSPSDFSDSLSAYPEFEFPDEPEVILMVGSPGSGKSYFVKSQLATKNYHIVSRDQLGSWQRCVATMKRLLQCQRSVVIDNTNPDKEARQRYIEVCHELKIPVRCFKMTTSLERAIHNNKFRQITDKSHELVPPHLIKNFFKELEEPTIDEGFKQVVEVPFVPNFKDRRHETIYKLFLT